LPVVAFTYKIINKDSAYEEFNTVDKRRRDL